MSSTHYNIPQPNFGILLPLKGPFREFRFYCLDQKLVYNANCQFIRSFNTTLPKQRVMKVGDRMGQERLLSLLSIAN